MKEKLILLHGALGTRNQFNELSELLTNQFEVFRFNFKGHGGRPIPEEFSMETFSNDLIDFLDKTDIHNTHIFGYSMGGYVALQAARNFPERIKKIITLGTKFKWTPESAAKEVKMLNPGIIEVKVPHFANKLKEDHHPNDWKAVVMNTANMMTNMGNGQKLNSDDFGKINTSVTIAIGDLDKMVSVEESEKVGDLIPTAKTVILKDVPHEIQKIKCNVLADFIKKELSK